MTKVKFKLEQFEGPLDLLLQLIEDKELDISQVSLGAVADQFVEHIEKAETISPEELADFLVVATRLLLIKSRLLLPVVEEEETDPAELENQLKIYREYLQASQELERMIFKERFSYARQKLPLVIKPVFNPPKELTTVRLKELFEDLIRVIEPIVILPESVIEKTVTLKDKLNHIKELIKSRSSISFKKLIEEARSRTEVIISFLALLELVKQREISVVQNKHFDDIKIQKQK